MPAGVFMEGRYGTGREKVPSEHAFAPSLFAAYRHQLQHLAQTESLIELFLDQQPLASPMVGAQQCRQKPLIPRRIALQLQDRGLDGRTKAGAHLHRFTGHKSLAPGLKSAFMLPIITISGRSCDTSEVFFRKPLV